MQIKEGVRYTKGNELTTPIRQIVVTALEREMTTKRELARAVSCTVREIDFLLTRGEIVINADVARKLLSGLGYELEIKVVKKENT